MPEQRVTVSVLDTEAFREFVRRVNDFVQEYAWHLRDCAAVDADGEWHLGNPPCSCGYEEDLAGLVPPSVQRSGAASPLVPIVLPALLTTEPCEAATRPLVAPPMISQTQSLCR